MNHSLTTPQTTNLRHLLSRCEQPGNGGAAHRQRLQKRGPRVREQWLHVVGVEVAPDPGQQGLLVGLGRAQAGRAVLHRIIL